MGSLNLSDVMDEVATVMGGLTHLRISPFPPPAVNPPSGFVSYPQSIDFDETYGRGVDKFVDLPITLVTSRVTDRSSRDAVTGWASGSGVNSIKQRMESHRWTTCDDLTITSCSFNVEEVAGVSYLVVIFVATVLGSGE